MLWFEGSSEELPPDQQIGSLLTSKSEKRQLELHLCKMVAVMFLLMCIWKVPDFTWYVTFNKILFCMLLHHRRSHQAPCRKIIQTSTILMKTATTTKISRKKRGSGSWTNRWTRYKTSSFRSISMKICHLFCFVMNSCDKFINSGVNIIATENWSLDLEGPGAPPRPGSILLRVEEHGCRCECRQAWLCWAEAEAGVG